MDENSKARPRWALGVKSSALPGNLARLSKAFSVKQASRFNEQSPTKEDSKDKLQDLDPDRLIGAFDDKLNDIQSLLKDYQNEGKQKPSEEEEKKKKNIAAVAASVAGEAFKGKSRNFTEEESYLNEKIQKRVRSAGAGASRGLSERVNELRSNAVARAELHERCLVHMKKKAEEEAREAAARGQSFDFIKGNKASLQGVVGIRSREAAARQANQRPATAPHRMMGHTRSTFSAQPGQGAQFLSGRMPAPGSSMSRISSARTASRRETADSLAQQVDASGGAHYIASPRPDSPPHDRSLVTFQRAYPPPASPIPPPLINLQRPHTAGMQGSSLEGPQLPLISKLSAGADPDAMKSRSQRPERLNVSKIRAESARTVRSESGRLGSPGTPSESQQEGYRSVFGMPDDQFIESYEACQAEALALLPEEEDTPTGRELQRLLTSRPGGGGSPTTRKQFIMQYKLLAKNRNDKMNEVRQRREDLDEERLARAALEAKMKVEADEQERQIKEQARRNTELILRHRAWLGICNLASKLNFVADVVKKDREVHPKRELRRHAAVTIAQWYKDLLYRRRFMQRVYLQRKLKFVLHPHLPAKQAEVRTRCGERLLHFCKLNAKGAAESALIAMKRFNKRLIIIQRAWRLSLVVQSLQRTLLYNHLAKFEKFIVAKAARGTLISEAAGRQKVRSLTSGKTMQRHDNSSTPKRESHSGKQKSKPAEVDHLDPVIEGALSNHTHPLPKDIKHQIVREALKDCRRKFHYEMMTYLSDRATYLAQKPIEDMRQKLLRDSGLTAPSELIEPRHPIMLSILPKSQLKAILYNGIQLVKTQKVQREAERKKEAERVWLELQELKATAAAKRREAFEGPLVSF